MRLRFVSILCLAAASACSALDPHIGPRRDDDDGAYDADTGASDGAGVVSFKNDIRPLMDRDDGATHPHGCKKCHYDPTGQGAIQVGLRLDTLGQLRTTGIDKPMIIAGDPAHSILVQKLKGTYAARPQRMPRDGAPGNYWTDAEIALVEQWIAQGAQGADDE
jgi:hypothetical protein